MQRRGGEEGRAAEDRCVGPRSAGGEEQLYLDPGPERRTAAAPGGRPQPQTA